MISYDVEKLIKQIYFGKVNKRKLPKELYFKIGNKLQEGVYKGFGSELMELKYGTPSFELLNELRTNTYIFSAAKTYHQVKDVSSLLLDGKKIRPFNEFKKEAGKVLDAYNDTYLRTEYDTAIGQAQTARNWQKAMSDKVVQFFKYDAVIDANTSDICKALNGLTLPKDDPIWRTKSPLNHFGCRCLLESLSMYDDVKVTSDKKANAIVKSVDEQINPVFNMNPGVSRVVFNKKHKYFEVEPKDKAYAKRNFDMPIPEAHGKK